MFPPTYSPTRTALRAVNSKEVRPGAATLVLVKVLRHVERVDFEDRHKPKCTESLATHESGHPTLSPQSSSWSTDVASRPCDEASVPS